MKTHSYTLIPVITILPDTSITHKYGLYILYNIGLLHRHDIIHKLKCDITQKNQ